MCCSFWEKCKNSPKTGLGCSTPLRCENNVEPKQNSSQTETICKLLRQNRYNRKLLGFLKRTKLHKSNITEGEQLAINNLRKDDSIMILPADKRRSIVIMNKSAYIKKSNDLLDDTSTYKSWN